MSDRSCRKNKNQVFQLEINAGRWGEGNTEKSVSWKRKGREEKNRDHTQELRPTGSPPTLTDFLWLCRWLSLLGQERKGQATHPNELTSQLTANYSEMTGKKDHLYRFGRTVTGTREQVTCKHFTFSADSPARKKKRKNRREKPRVSDEPTHRNELLIHPGGAAHTAETQNWLMWLC